MDLPDTGTSPESKKHTLLEIGGFPTGNKINKENIRVVMFDLMTSADFSCDDPNASVMVVMQSPANWWMPIGDVRLEECVLVERASAGRKTGGADQGVAFIGKGHIHPQREQAGQGINLVRSRWYDNAMIPCPV